MQNLFSELDRSLPEELAETLVNSSSVRIERIVSTGQTSEPDYWYDQDEAEWVVVLKGAAKIRFNDQGSDVDLGPGDWINIPAHRRHRVEWTSLDEPTVWLAVFYRDEIQQ